MPAKAENEKENLSYLFSEYLKRQWKNEEKNVE
jgi:hypothetical protein